MAAQGPVVSNPIDNTVILEPDEAGDDSSRLRCFWCKSERPANLVCECPGCGRTADVVLGESTTLGQLAALLGGVDQMFSVEVAKVVPEDSRDKLFGGALITLIQIDESGGGSAVNQATLYWPIS